MSDITSSLIIGIPEFDRVTAKTEMPLRKMYLFRPSVTLE